MLIIVSMIGLIMSLMFTYVVEWSFLFSGLMWVGFLVGLLGYFEGFFFYYSSYGIMLDLMSWSLVYLTFWISGLMILSSLLVYVYSSFAKEFSYTVLFLCLFLIMVFYVGDFMWLYVFFEASLIPTFFLISGWGYQPERLKAGLYLFFYTMFGSLPLLLGILFINNGIYSMSFHLFLMNSFNSVILCLVMIGAFLVKMPMFFVHLWLPSAHVEAPVSGSMVLAGVLLKLGGYGLLRIMLLFPSILMSIGSFFLLLSLFGGVMISLLCLRQYDLKSLIAYSSVVHMGLALAGIMVMTNWSYQGTLSLMLGHGLCSSGLFAGANILYERGGTRSMVLNKGMINMFPGFIMWWFMICVCNMAAPPSLNLLGEISLMISLISWSVGLGMLLALVSFFSAAYSIYLFSLVSHGKLLFSFGFSDIKAREYMLMVLHWIPLNFIMLSGDIAFSWLF